MENVSGALKISISMLIFVLALGTFFFLIARIKELSDAILYHSDYTNFYQWIESNSISGEKIVDENTVVAAIYSQEVSPVHVFIKKNGTFIYRGNRNNIQEFVKNRLSSDKKYIENIVEVNVSGKYRTASDDTKVILERGNTETFIFYTQIN